MPKLGAFQPGPDPRRNAGGRPKALKDVVEAARTHTVAAIVVLADISGDVSQPAAARVSASIALLDRGWGKTAQPLQHSGDLTLSTGIADRLGTARRRLADVVQGLVLPADVANDDPLIHDAASDGA